jgi:hypothetical protein
LAGFAAQRSQVPLRVVPLEQPTDGAIPLTFAIAMGVRKDDETRAAELTGVIARKTSEIMAVLRSAGVPLVPLAKAPGVYAESADRRSDVAP